MTSMFAKNRMELGTWLCDRVGCHPRSAVYGLPVAVGIAKSWAQYVATVNRVNAPH